MAGRWQVQLCSFLPLRFCRLLEPFQHTFSARCLAAFGSTNRLAPWRITWCIWAEKLRQFLICHVADFIGLGGDPRRIKGASNHFTVINGMGAPFWLMFTRFAYHVFPSTGCCSHRFQQASQPSQPYSSFAQSQSMSGGQPSATASVSTCAIRLMSILSKLVIHYHSFGGSGGIHMRPAFVTAFRQNKLIVAVENRLSSAVGTYIGSDRVTP